jgi:transcription initiation factor IIE alpha subunit
MAEGGHLHAHVVELVELVGRMFYRDEYIVVLDALTRELCLRNDGLEEYFALPLKQVRVILQDLLSDHLVCVADVKERREKKRGACAQIITMSDWRTVEAARHITCSPQRNRLGRRA